MKYLSLFSGIGGFEVGLNNSYLNFECIGYSEIEENAKQVYQRHFPEHVDFGDVKEIRTSELPDFDLLVGGFPCQAFSIAGRKRGFDDTRGTLFFEITRILKDKKPKYFLLENVRNLLSHDCGRTFKTMLRVLSDLGYYVRWEVHNSKDYGLPQRRERVFIEGYYNKRRERAFDEILHKQSSTGYNPNKIRNLFGTGSLSQQQRLISAEGLSPTVTKNDTTGFFFDGYDFRLLTPVELERLQGFTDDYTRYGVNGEISETQRRILLGNAVTTNVVTNIVNVMFD